MGIGSGTKTELITSYMQYTNDCTDNTSTNTDTNIKETGISKKHLRSYRGQTIALDFPNIACRFLHRADNLTSFLFEFINLMHKFERYGIDILIVFYGRPRDEKQLVIEHRKNFRGKV